MKILAVACYTGDETLCAMTERMVDDLKECPLPDGVEMNILLVAQGAARGIESEGVFVGIDAVNRGFAKGINNAIRLGVQGWGAPDYVLVLNNDLRFPRRDWLRILLGEAHPRRITVPATDKAALRTQKGPVDKEPMDVRESSAYAWLVPFTWCEYLMRTYHWPLFCPEFESYGEDNWTAFLLAKRFGQRIFRYVPRSWVRHLRAQTSSQVKVDRRASSRLLSSKLEGELKNPKLPIHLQRWAKEYIRALAPRK